MRFPFHRLRHSRGCTVLAAGASLALCFPNASLFAQTPSPQPTVVIGGNPSPSAPQVVPAERAVAPARDYNALILAAIGRMPEGGTYRTNAVAFAGLRRSIQVSNSGLTIDAAQATPSFCSGATYLVFLSVLAQLNRNGQLPLDYNTLASLVVQQPQPDGVGVWGRWNANGPGTARLFHEANLGRSFTDFAEARPGDFLKVFWNDEIGQREAGHSVVYLASITRPDGEYVQFWSSNQPNGYGVKTIPKQRIRRQLFTRLEHPENVARLSTLPAKDAYLAAMLKRPSSHREMLQMVGAPDEPGPAPRAVTPAPKVATPAPGKSAAGEATPKKGLFNRLLKN